MQYKVYKIINNINGKIYIGVTKNLIKNRFKEHCKALSYIGRSIRKHGKDNFSIYSIHEFPTKDEAYVKEAEIVDSIFLKRSDTMNEKLGGEGGWDHITSEHKPNRTFSEKAKEASLNKIKLLKQDKNWVNNHKNKVKEGMVKYFNNGGIAGFQDKKHTDEIKQKISESSKGKHSGEKNGNFGKIWIYSLEEKLSKQIKKDTLKEYEELGWTKGRKLKW